MNFWNVKAMLMMFNLLITPFIKTPGCHHHNFAQEFERYEKNKFNRIVRRVVV